MRLDSYSFYFLLKSAGVSSIFWSSSTSFRLSSFLLQSKKGSLGTYAKEFARNSVEYPDRFGYLWKAAAEISQEICEAVLGMMLGFLPLQRKRLFQNRNEPETAKN